MGLSLLAAVLVSAAPSPVVVQVFTSEGCSSCPPADEFVKSLDGPDVVALGFHVDYWNRLGWKDPFSDPAFSALQERYARAAGDDGVYTPHLLVNGRTVRNGEVREAIADARKRPLLSLNARLVETDGKLRVEVAVPKGAVKNAELVALVTERDLRSKVTAGENAGRTLELAPVVRVLQPLGNASSEGATLTATLPINASWKRENLSVIVLAQDEALRIIGATRLKLPPH